MNTQLNELHLFAGAGGGIIGGMLCGHTTVCAVEIEPYCRKVLLQRQRDGILPKFPIWDDVRTFDGKPWRGKVDIVCGGFPCQDISAAGKGAGIEGSRSSMWKHMARVIGEVRPRYAFVENSPMLVGRGLSTVLADLAEMGYDARWGIVGAHHVSAPHKRDRIWILAYTNLHSDKREIDRIMGEKEREARENESLHSSSWNAIGASKHEWEHSVHGLEQVTKESCGDVSNSNLSQRKGMRCTSRSNQEYSDIVPRCSWWRQDPAEALESPVGRVANGVANRVDRLKAIGNGQVSSVARLAWNILKL
jgi:DNA (cytosine-5)-methyltransferase 1